MLASTKSRIALVVASLIATGPALADAPAGIQAGTSGGVHGEVQIAKADYVTPQRQIGHQIGSGEPIYMGDQISTGAGGGLQVMLLDQTVMTLGQNAKMTIDEMVYDPKSGTGKLNFNVTQGAFRFVSGQIAKANPENVNIKTPMATIGIRGTLVGGSVDPGTTLVALLGPGDQTNTGARHGAIEVSTPAGTVSISRTGYSTVITPGAPPSPPAPVTAEQLQRFGQAGAGSSGTAATATSTQSNSGGSTSSSTASSSRASSANSLSGEGLASGGAISNVVTTFVSTLQQQSKTVSDNSSTGKQTAVAADNNSSSSTVSDNNSSSSTVSDNNSSSSTVSDNSSTGKQTGGAAGNNSSSSSNDDGNFTSLAGSTVVPFYRSYLSYSSDNSGVDNDGIGTTTTTLTSFTNSHNWSFYDPANGDTVTFSNWSTTSTDTISGLPDGTKYASATGTGSTNGVYYAYDLSDTASLSSTKYGLWLGGSSDHFSWSDNELTGFTNATLGAYSFGVKTASMPSSGYATYSGNLAGLGASGSSIYAFTTTVLLNANFSNNTISGLTGTLSSANFLAVKGSAPSTPFTQLSFLGGISNGTSTFSGTSINVAGASFSPSSSSFAGQFNGTTAAELGGTFKVVDSSSNNHIVGSFGAARGPVSVYAP